MGEMMVMVCKEEKESGGDTSSNAKEYHELN